MLSTILRTGDLKKNLLSAMKKNKVEQWVVRDWVGAEEVKSKFRERFSE